MIKLFSLLFVALIQVHATEYYVAIQGNDSNDGSVSYPFRTIERARVAVSSLTRPLTEPVTVWVKEGRYYLAEPLNLGLNDCGSGPSNMVTYSAYETETVVIIGGTLLYPQAFTPYKHGVNAAIQQINLAAQNITDFGTLSPRGMSDCSACISSAEFYLSALEVFQYPPQDTYLARYPSKGTYTNTVKVYDNGLAFTYEGGEPKLWIGETDIWVHGYWEATWTDKHLKVESVDLANSMFNISSQTPPNFGMKAGDPYYAYNILAELDSPGEYYLNRSSGILYFWPPSQGFGVDTYVSMLPYVIQTTNVSYVQFAGFTIAGSRGAGIQIFNSSFVNVIGSTFVDLGTIAVNITGGANNTVQNCTVSNTGNGGIYLEGGDRFTLTPSSFVVSKCDISQYNRWIFTYAPGIFINGVGQQVLNNFVHNGPHQGIFLSGNDHTLQGNTLSDLVYETADAGAFYMGRDWSYRGNLITNNTFKNINTLLGSGEDKAIALYLDDSGSGFTVTRNNFINCSTGIMVGGGRDNHIEANYFMGTVTSITQKKPAGNIHITDSTAYNLGIHFDNRDMGWSSSFCASGGLGTQFLNRINYTSTYYAKYPHLQNILQDDPCMPKYNDFSNNTYCQLTQFLDVSDTQIAQWNSTSANNNQVC